MKKYLLIFILTLLLFPLVSAVPPFIPEENINGIEIFEQRITFLPLNTDYESHIHISNITNGMPLPNDEASCYFHLYNNSGNHVFQSNPLESLINGWDYEVLIKAGNFSNAGMFTYNIFCNTTEITDQSGIGGVVKGNFEVNYSGKDLTESQSIIYFVLLGILILTLFAIFFGMSFLPSSNERDEEGKILSVSYLKYLRLPLWLFAYFLFIAIVYLSSNIGFAFLPGQLFAKLLFAIFVILMSLSTLVIIIIIISFFVKFYHDKDFQKYFSRGFFPGEQL